MIAEKPHQQHLATSDSLITSYEATRAGFVALALEKSRRATPFVAEARILQSVASQANTPAELLQLDEVQAALLTAAGVSCKAAAYLQAQDKQEAIQGLISNFLEPAGALFVEELIFRFLLTRGDALGGSMRNVGGVLAQRRLTRALLSTLTVGGKPYRWLDARTGTWLEMSNDDFDIELHLKGLSWQVDDLSRTLIYNLNVPVVTRNIDLCIFRVAPSQLSTAVFDDASSYVALGELKGGIAPAGADEHWKTARTALNRIRQSFLRHGLSPALFFVGAAIERKMAVEIWNQLEDGSLTNAANLTDETQLAAVACWLCGL